MMRNKHSKKSNDIKSKASKNTVSVVAPNVTIDIESPPISTTEDRLLNTPITSAIQESHSKMISFNTTKSVLDLITNSFTEYGKHLYSKYISDNEDDGNGYMRLMGNSYLRNVRFVLNPTWVDMNHDYEYPDWRTTDGLDELFYMISEENKNSWLFQLVKTFGDDFHLSDETILEAIEALMDGVYNDEFLANNDRNYRDFMYYFDILKSYCNVVRRDNKYTENIYHFGSLLQINDNISSLYQEYTNVEACVATKNFVMAFNSLNALKRNNLSTAIALACCESDIKMYLNMILIPFLGVSYALRHLYMEDNLIDIDNNTQLLSKLCVTKPQESWIDVDPDFDEEEYRKKRIADMEFQRAKRALEEEERRRIINETPIIVHNERPPILNIRFAQKLEEYKRNEEKTAVKSSPTSSVNSRASAFITEKSSTNDSPSNSVSSHNTNSRTYVSHDFVFERSDIPKSMRRGEKTGVNGRNTGFFIFYSGRNNDTVYERKAIVTSNGNCSMKEVCEELPRLLVEKERALRGSRNMIFGKTIEELYQTDLRKKTYYYTNARRAVISFCNEIAATSRNDNEARMRIIELYYGPRREGETELMYMNSFMYDIFRSFVNFYTYAKTL